MMYHSKNKWIDKVILIVFAAAFFISCGDSGMPAKITFTKAELQDKIKGGWAGQTIGVVFGAPTEFEI